MILFGLKWNPWKSFWSMVWNVCEAYRIPAGRFAPWMLGQIIGCKRGPVKGKP